MKERRGAAVVIVVIVLVILLMISAVMPFIFMSRGGGLDKATGFYGVSGGDVACVETDLLNLPRQTQILDRVVANLPVYKEAASKHNIPWQMLAAIHIRENDAKPGNPKNRQGPFQLYSLSISQPGHEALSNFSTAADYVANSLANDYSNRYKSRSGVNITEKLSLTAPNELIQGTFWAYNGLVGTLNRSSYVWNFYSSDYAGADGKGMNWPVEHSLSGRDTRDGTFSTYAYLSYSSTIVNGKIVKKTCGSGPSGTTVAGIASVRGLAPPVENWGSHIPTKRHWRLYDDEVAVDIGVGEGTNVFSITDGVVSAIYTDPSKNCGYGIRVNSSGAHNGLTILYCHFSKGVELRRGQSVKAGQFIGKSGATGSVRSSRPGGSGAHLHIQAGGGFLSKHNHTNAKSAKDSARSEAFRGWLNAIPK